MTALFAAADVAGLATNVETVLVSLIGVALLFVGAKYVKKAMNR